MTQTGQNPSPEDFSQVDNNLDTILATLAQDEVVYISNPDQIDEAFFDPVSVCVAEKLALDFGAAVSPADVAIARTSLERMQRVRPMYIEQSTSYL
ncbi:hypothetical protein [Kaistia sp. MMO-174]|uniref:hypothetical protein n=1 Tax=Kaistia sp. MMO-174 TaxID=3081256 RepID=UPI0030170989